MDSFLPTDQVSTETGQVQKRYKPEEIVNLLRQAEVLHGQGLSMADSIRQLGISEVTSYRWRKEYAGMSGDQLRRLSGA